MRYIGSKSKVVPFIIDVINYKIGSLEERTVADLFAGTACVGDKFKQLGARVISNDYLAFSYALQVSKIKLNNMPTGQIEYMAALNELNHLDGVEGFFFEQYTKEGTINKEYERNYFSELNAKKIDAIRIKINEWADKGVIDNDYFQCLCASLVDAITKVSNTSGTYGAFLKIDDKRKYKELHLEPLAFFNNHKKNECYCEDIYTVIDHVEGDILYLDPPYNNRQYPPYYHILETAVKYDWPEIYGKTGRRHYENQMSPFCIKAEAEKALLHVINNSKFKHIFLSYSNDGIIDIDEMSQKIVQAEDVQIFHQEHRRYKSNSNGIAEKKKLKELILYVCKKG